MAPQRKSSGEWRIFSPTIPASRQPTGRSAVSLDSDSDTETIDLPIAQSDQVAPSSPPDVKNDTEPEAKITAGMVLSRIYTGTGPEAYLPPNHSSLSQSDVTQDLEKSKCSEYPERVDGFGEVYRWALRAGTKVRIKILKIIGSTGDEKKLVKHAAHELYV
ncbi:hypothetical protein FRC11_014158 [Ceratobasidium sp. 423]|nr:hypothetical protein FRC11_014158 [Ceratobasidium sp. 423]